MKNIELALLSAFAGVGTGSSTPMEPRAQPACVPTTFEPFVPTNATVESARPVGIDGTYVEPFNIAYPAPATGLPASTCAVVIRVPSSSQSAYRIGLLLPPRDTWNGRFLAVGNGAFAGGINWADAGHGVSGYGFAAASTDTGHNSSAIDLSWALGNPEKLTDFGWRAMHGTALVGKTVIAGYYGTPASRSYYSGCSTGGRQGLRAAMVDPDAFDGLLVGAPAWWSSHLSPWTTRVGAWNLPTTSPGHIPARLMSGLLAREAIRQCDSLDGVKDGIVSNPEDCRIDFDGMLCHNDTVNECLSVPQVDTARRVYGDYYADNRFAFPGYSISSEQQWPFVLGQPAPSPLGTDYIRHMLLSDPAWRWQDYNDSLVWLADKMDPGAQTADKFDALVSYGLGESTKSKKGGRIIIYHGWADGVIPARSSRVFFDKMSAAHANLNTSTATSMSDYLRLFMVPGMGHCAGSAVDAPWYIAGANQQGALAPGQPKPATNNATTDALRALMAWVEEGKPTESIVATAFRARNGTTVLRQRPLCPWPKTAVLTAGKDETLAESWSCR